MIAAGNAFEENLKAIARSISRLRPGATGVILLVDEAGEILIQSNSSEVVSSLLSAIRGDGKSIPAIDVGSFAAYNGVPVICSDIPNDDRWPPAWCKLCAAHNIGAFCSSPIDSGWKTPGSVMLCFDQVHEIDEWEQHVVHYASSITGIAIAQERNVRALRLQAERARQSEELAVVGRLSASIAHEINNPLSAIANLLYLLLQDRTLSESAQSYVTTAQSELHRVSQITTQTLKFYRQRSTTERCSVGEIIQGLLSLYRIRLEQAHVSIYFKEAPAEPILCHAGELRQVFANLLTNALDALAKTGGFIRVRVRPSTVWKRGVPGVRITIADNGQGMDTATRARIYEALFTTKSTMGTGLGLWITAELVNKHGGTIYVRSQMGRGTAFTVVLPTDGPQASPNS